VIEKKGLANSTAALATSTALAAGLMLLSFSGNPYSLAGQAGQQTGGNMTDGNKTQFPVNQTPSPDQVPNEMLQNTSVPKDNDLITSIAKSVFKAFSGTQPQIPENMPVNTTGNTTQNITDNNTDNNTQLPGNKTEPDINQTDNLTENITEPQEEFNDTNTTEPPLNDSSLNVSEEQLGFAAKLVKNIMQVFGGGSQTDTQKSQTNGTTGNQTGDSTENRTQPDPENSTDPKQPEQNNQTSPEQNETKQTSSKSNEKKEDRGILPDIGLKILIPLITLIAGVLTLLTYFRSDKDAKEFLKALAEKIENFIYSIPDLFRRTVVNIVSFAYSKFQALKNLMIRIIKAPAETIANIRENLGRKIEKIRIRLNRLNQRSLRQNLEVIVKGQQTTYEGLDEIWHELKVKTMMKNDTTVTPAEVRAEAVKKNLPQETVDQIVEAFRQENYTAAGYPDMLDISKWEKDLKGDNQ